LFSGIHSTIILNATMQKHASYFSVPFTLLVLLVLSSVFADVARAQGQIVWAAPERPSRLEMTRATLDDGTYIKITYGSPRIRNPQTNQSRKIFGEDTTAVVPFGTVWRLGANEATELTTTGNIIFGGKELPAGTYTLFAIPQRDNWTIIVNGQPGQWGAYEYEKYKDKNVMEITVPAQQSDLTYEALTMNIADDEEGRTLMIRWENTLVEIPIRTK
jgi:hypothetical protein